MSLVLRFFGAVDVNINFRCMIISVKRSTIFVGSQKKIYILVLCEIFLLYPRNLPYIFSPLRKTCMAIGIGVSGICSSWEQGSGDVTIPGSSFCLTAPNTGPDFIFHGSTRDPTWSWWGLCISDFSKKDAP